MGPTWLRVRDLLGRAASLGHLEDGGGNVGGEDDHTARVPRCATTFGRLAEYLLRSAGQRNFLQLPRRKETNVLAIWRPERKYRLLGFSHLAHRPSGHVADPQPFSGSVTAGQKRKFRTIRRKCQRTVVNGGEF